MKLAVIFLFLSLYGWGAVAVDAVMTGGNGAGGTNAQLSTAGKTITTTGMTVGASATLLLAVIALGNSNPTVSPTCTWDTTGTPQGMTLRANATDSTANFVGIFSLVSPHAGNKTLSCSWTTYDNQAYLSAISFTGTDTSTGLNLSDNNSTASGSSLAITSDAAGATLAAFMDAGSGPTPNSTGGFTVVFNAGNLSPDAAANYKLGGTSNTHTATETCLIAGVHIIAGTTPAAKATVVIIE